MSKKIFVSFIVFLFIWACLFLQINLLNKIPLFGVPANIGIVVIAGIGLLADKLPGTLVGGAYGLILDILYGKSIGVYFVIYALMGFASGTLSKGFSKENKLSMVYMTALFTAVVELMTYVVFIVIYGYHLELISACLIILREVIYNMFLARILFKPLSGLGEIINKSKNSYYLL